MSSGVEKWRGRRGSRVAQSKKLDIPQAVRNTLQSFNILQKSVQNYPVMDEPPQSLRALFAKAEQERISLEASPSTISATFQENLSSAILTYEECLRVADRVSLFSPNETLDDINSGDLQYLLLNYHLAELILKATGGDRKATLRRAQIHLERFLKLLDNYDILSKQDARMFEQYTENKDGFSTASKTDATARRETKIARFKEEKELKRKLEVLRSFL